MELTIDARPENLSLIADFVHKSMTQLGIGKGILEVQTAVDEACTNIIKHSYSDQGGIIAITLELQGDDLVVTIRDKGRPFNPDFVPPPDLEADLDKRKVGGLGIFLMRKLMDSVSYSFDAREGNKLVMKKKLAPNK